MVVALFAGIWAYSAWSQEQPMVVLEDGKAVTGGITMKTVPMTSDRTMTAGTHQADVEESEIDWEAGKPAIAGYVHHGTFALRSGEVTLTGDQLTGEFVIDVDSLQVTSLGGGKAGQESTLEGHLKGERFFDVANNPTATFKITKVEPQILPGPGQAEYTATGELTMKGKTNEVTFPMKVVVDGDEKVYVTANLEIDRTKWGIDFGSVTVAEKITENIIGDSVKLDLKIWLTK